MPGSRWQAAHGRLIVSCQASPGDAFHAPGMMARFARDAVAGGAGAIRAHGPGDVADIRAAVDVPVLAIHKEVIDDGAILITPTFDRALALARAGADAIALDCTARGVRHGALDRLRRIRAELKLPVLADIATLDEAEAAERAGADFILSTMRGFTAETRHLALSFEPEFIAELVRRLTVPVIAEGRIATPSDARAAMDAGAWAVVVGTAITRPREITRAFAQALAARRPAWTAAIDIGATNIKWGTVSHQGEIEAAASAPTSHDGAAALLQQVRLILRNILDNSPRPIGAVAAATAGWVDRRTGSILHATGNLAGWTGAKLRGALAEETSLPVFVENDAYCAAAGEWLFGAARGERNALCVTLGTGIGAGAIVEGRLLAGRHGLAAMLGHIPLPGATRPCNCGLLGCMEAETRGLDDMERYATLLALGLASAIHLLDPAVIVLCGGIAAAHPELPQLVEHELSARALAWSSRAVTVRLSTAGEYAGVRGAAAMALLRSPQDS